MTKEEQTLFFYWSEGINAYVQDSYFLPLEYYILWIGYEKWQPIDSVYQMKSFELDFQKNVVTDLVREHLIDFWGVDLACALQPWKGCETQEDITPGMSVSGYQMSSKSSSECYGCQFQFERSKLIGFIDSTWQTTGGGSNGFAISGEYTRSGKPMLENDPHVESLVPTIIYIIGVTEYDGWSWNATLFGFPFSPSVQNKDYASGVTIAPIDGIDFYKINVVDDQYYMLDGEKKKFEIQNETFKIKDGLGYKYVDWVFKWTIFGPIIDNYDDSYKNVNAFNELYENKQPNIKYAMKSVFNEGTKVKFDFFMKLVRVKSLEEAKELVLSDQVQIYIPINLVSTDSEGNYGTFTIGMIPKRPTHVSGHVPIDGSLSSNNWIGLHSCKYNPYSINNPNGFIAVANMTPHYPNDFESDHIELGTKLGFMRRQLRINEMLFALVDRVKSGGDKINISDVNDIYHDVLDTMARDYFPFLLEIIDTNYTFSTSDSDIVMKYIFDDLKEWDYRLTKETFAGTFWNHWLTEIFSNLFKDEMVDNPIIYSVISSDIFGYQLYIENFLGKWKQYYKKGSLNTTKNIYTLLCDNVKYDYKVETCTEHIINAFKRTMEYLVIDNRYVSWGKYHIGYHPHMPFDNSDFLREYFTRTSNRKGGFSTVFVGAFRLNSDRLGSPILSDGRPSYKSTWHACMRWMVDMGGVSYYSMDTGVSGHVSSPHYFDQNNTHENGRGFPLWLGSKNVNIHKLVFTNPKKDL